MLFQIELTSEAAPLQSSLHAAGTFPPVGAELAYFTNTSADTLRGRGIDPVPIGATRDEFCNALADGDFDVLHISRHAESLHELD